MAIWNAIKDSQQTGDYETFLETYPNSPMAPFAKRRLEAFSKTKATRSSEEAERAGSKQRQQAKAEAEAARKRSEQQAARARERELWEAVSSSEDPAVVQAFLNRYPKSDYAPLASARVATLKARTADATRRPQQATPQKLASRQPVKETGSQSSNFDGRWLGSAFGCVPVLGYHPVDYDIDVVLSGGNVIGEVRKTSLKGNVSVLELEAQLSDRAPFKFHITRVGLDVFAAFARDQERADGTINGCGLILTRTNAPAQ